MTTPNRPWTCRLNLHHSWEWTQTPDGQRYVRCSRCHKEKDDDQGSQGRKTAGFSLGGGG